MLTSPRSFNRFIDFISSIQSFKFHSGFRPRNIGTKKKQLQRQLSHEYWFFAFSKIYCCWCLLLVHWWHTFSAKKLYFFFYFYWNTAQFVHALLCGIFLFAKWNSNRQKFNLWLKLFCNKCQSKKKA